MSCSSSWLTVSAGDSPGFKRRFAILNCKFYYVKMSPFYAANNHAKIIEILKWSARNARRNYHLFIALSASKIYVKIETLRYMQRENDEAMHDLPYVRHVVCRLNPNDLRASALLAANALQITKTTNYEH